MTDERELLRYVIESAVRHVQRSRTLRADTAAEVGEMVLSDLQRLGVSVVRVHANGHHKDD